jgi:hypothetical protein
MPEDEILTARRIVGDLQNLADGLRSRLGDVFPVRRLLNDLESIDIHLDELFSGFVPVPRGKEVVLVPDTPYDPQMWHAADDEGLGGRRHHSMD